MMVEPSCPATPRGEWECAGEVPDDEAGDERRGDDEVGGHDAAGAARQLDHGGDSGEVVADDDGVGGLQGEVGPGAAHGDAGVRGGQRGGVVDAVADHGDPLPAGFELADGSDLILGQQPGAHVGDADLADEPAAAVELSPVSSTGVAPLSRVTRRLPRPPS